MCASGITELKGLNSKLQRPEKKRRDGLKEDVLLLLMFQHDVKGEGSHRENKRCERKAERESQRDETCEREGGGEGGDGEEALKQTKRRKNPARLLFKSSSFILL